MKEFIVEQLMERFKITEEHASEIYEDLKNRQRIESLIIMIDTFQSLSQLEKYYYGG